jgi:hypothetical protein
MFFRALLTPLLAGALLNLDRRAFAQNMLGRPITTGLIIGFFINNLPLGLSLGLWTELLWLWRLTVGGDHTPNGSLALTTVLISLNLVSGELKLISPSLPLASLAFFLIPPLAQLLIKADKLSRAFSTRVSSHLRQRLSLASGEAKPLSSGDGLPEDGEGGAVGKGGATGDGEEEEPDGGPEPAPLNGSSQSLPSLTLINLSGLLHTYVLALVFLLIFCPLTGLVFVLAGKCLPPGFFPPLAKFQLFAPAVALLGVASSLAAPPLKIYGLGILCGFVIVGILALFGI